MDLTPLPFWGGETGGNDDSGIAVHTIAGIYDLINPVTKLVIPAVAERRAGTQKRHCDYWIPAFARMTG